MPETITQSDWDAMAKSLNVIEYKTYQWQMSPIEVEFLANKNKEPAQPQDEHGQFLFGFMQ